MKNIHAIASAICLAGFSVGGFVHSAELMQGRCRMDHCTWFSIESRDIIGSNAHGALFKVVSKGWTSHHPGGEYGKPRPRTGGETSTGYYFCSKTKPSALWEADAGRWTVAALNVASPSGAEENAVIEYFAVCHGMQSGHDKTASFRELAEGFRYSPAETIDLRAIAHPEDISKG
jgi:hypothetical protein